MAAAFIALTALIVPLAGCAGAAVVVDPKAETRIGQDVAERRLWMQTRDAGPDVAERRLWMQMQARENGPDVGPDVAERRLWMNDGT